MINNNIETFLEQLKEHESEDFRYDHEGLANEYQSIADNQSSLAIKILSIIGGLLGMAAFWMFLGILGFLDNEMNTMILGFILFIGALIINRMTKTIFLDTISVSALVSSFLMIIAGLDELGLSQNIIPILIILLASFALILSRNYIYTFISVLTIEIMCIFLITNNEVHNLIHAYIAINTILLTIWIINESGIITSDKLFSKTYEPIRIGLIFSLILGLGLIGIKGFYLNMEGENLTWISSIATIPVVFYLVNIILNILEVNTTQAKTIVFTICALILASIFNAPAISGAIVILLLCFYANYQTGIVISIIALVYFVGQYYYDLNLTLLTKSIILFSSGVLFLILYFLTHKKLDTHEAH